MATMVPQSHASTAEMPRKKTKKYNDRLEYDARGISESAKGHVIRGEGGGNTSLKQIFLLLCKIFQRPMSMIRTPFSHFSCVSYAALSHSG